MSPAPDVRTNSRELSRWIVPALFALIGAIAASAQEAARSRTSARDRAVSPKLPGAVSKAPTWLGSETPFDLAKFFAAPPRDLNAELLYLDALFEFGAEIADCYPAGPERERRRQAAMDRFKRFNELMQPIYNKADAEVPADVATEVIGLYEVGLLKLREAQGRDQCVFEGGLGADALLPHAPVARLVTRITALRVQQSVQRGDLEAAIRDVELILRLVRDLQRRGSRITQLIGAAVTQVAGFTMVSAILSSPRLKPKDCDSLRKVLLAHDQKSTDGYAEGLRADYIAAHATFRDVVLHQRDLATRLKVKPGESVVRALLKQINFGDVGDLVPDDVDARLARTTPAELSVRERSIDRYYRTALSFDGLPAAERIAKTKAIAKIEGAGPLAFVIGNLLAPETLESAVQSTSCVRATLRADLCLVALRRWQLTHRGLPSSLSIAVNDAGLKSVPIDPYDGKPMRFVALGGEPVVYSVGRDAQDDGGKKDSKYDMQPGDLLYRLPAIEQHRRIRPTGHRAKPETARASRST